MNTTREQIVELVYRAVDEINEDLKVETRLVKKPETVLFGRTATIDSMSLVSFIVAVEQQLHDEFSLGVTLANEKAMSMERSPFRTLESMIDYVCEVVAEADGG